jgi:hypothetical protein
MWEKQRNTLRPCGVRRLSAKEISTGNLFTWHILVFFAKKAFYLSDSGNEVPVYFYENVTGVIKNKKK